MPSLLGLIILILFAGLVGLKKVADTDTFSHLGCGEWMLQHHELLRHNVFGIPDPSNPAENWIDVHWGFQLLLAIIHRVGGFELLSIFNSIFAAMFVFVLWAALHRRISIGWIVFGGLIALPAMDERLVLRPEIITFSLLLLTMALVDQVREGAPPRRLLWLAGVFVLWVNMHGLYFLGPVIMWSAAVGDKLDQLFHKGQAGFGKLSSRRAIAFMALASAACLINPWTWKMVIHPLILSSRMARPLYVANVQEFQRTTQCLWRDWQNGFRMSVIRHMLPALLASFVLLIRWRKVSLVQVLWFALFTAMGLAAIRNLVMMAVPCSYLLAFNGSSWWSETAKTFLARRSCLQSLCMRQVIAVLLLAFLLVAVSFRMAISPRTKIIGIGLIDSPMIYDTGDYLARLKMPGDVLSIEFGGGGPLIYQMNAHHNVNRHIWLDGRLEAYSYQRFRDFVGIVNDETLQFSPNASQVFTDFPSGSMKSVRFVVADSDSVPHILAFSHCAAYRLCHIEPTALCFVRVDGAAMGDPDLKPNWADYDLPLTPAGEIQTATPFWSARNPQPLLQLAESQLALSGEAPGLGPRTEPLVGEKASLLAIRYGTVALTQKLSPSDKATLFLALAMQQRSRMRRIPISKIFPVEICAARSLYLFDHIDFAIFKSPEDRNSFFHGFVDELLMGGHLDVAAQAAESLCRMAEEGHAFPVGEVRPIKDHVDAIMAKIDSGIDPRELERLAPLDRARLLASARYGLTNAALQVLHDQARPTSDMELFEGDLWLRQGRVEAARRAYQAAALPEKDFDLRLRLALCQWVEGDLFAAHDELVDLCTESSQPISKYYLTELSNELGDYQTTKVLALNVDEFILQATRAGLQFR